MPYYDERLPNNYQTRNSYPTMSEPPSYGRTSTPTTARQTGFPVIYGRPVNAIEDVMPNEVPMDGNISVFPKTDWTVIYAKVWTSDGTLRTFKFIPEETIPTRSNDANTQPLDALKPALTNVAERLQAIEALLQPLCGSPVLGQSEKEGSK